MDPETVTTTQTIIIDSEPKIITKKITAEKSKTGLIIISLALSIFIVLVLILVGRFYFAKQLNKKLNTESQIKRIQEVRQREVNQTE